MHTNNWLSVQRYGQMGGMARHTNDKLPSHDDLESISYSELRILYETLLHARPPTRISRDALKGNIAWALQVLDQGKTPNSLRQTLIQQLNSANSRTAGPGAAGTRLIREWQGKTYQVTVLDRGYSWRNKRYNSLSRIAEEITGTRWSGPRFFGLRENNQ